MTRADLDKASLEADAAMDRLQKVFPDHAPTPQVEQQIAADFYIEFQTVCQREGDDTLPGDVAKWVMKWIR